MTNNQNLPLLLIPGLACTEALFAHQIPVLGADRDVLIADHTGFDSVGAIVNSILKKAPERFALAGLSMGGHLCFEILRQAPERVERLALLDTSSRGDLIERANQCLAGIALAKSGNFDQVCQAFLDISIAHSRADDADLKRGIVNMAMDMGVENWILQV